jgi:hypothetical protein
MAFIARLETNGIHEYFQAMFGETVLALKERYCKKHGLTTASVKAFVDNVPLNDTDTLDKAKVDMFTTVVMRLEPVEMNAISFAVTEPKMSAMLRPWSSADSNGKPKILGLF